MGKIYSFHSFFAVFCSIHKKGTNRSISKGTNRSISKGIKSSRLRVNKVKKSRRKVWTERGEKITQRIGQLLSRGRNEIPRELPNNIFGLIDKNYDNL
ncbi:hypothetical protein DI09_79p160 [Mitosporidium daphniae]|uniref:Uncharacterized protein n=1 Tax=Mitosporidium daphniae TaxID=1485682 RepID=A0A098VML5_9MICR|nr:uncharacterized protein DI09_79p160 [Mitosporidium daphniae]KGG50293.1 hypothetical protein DI09_79p160 [Mitosporidium daphniae]|eukprot:XP_013236720.1 uncharacterized protein DI09_79p160 [Mitosporidium daphniae]